MAGQFIPDAPASPSTRFVPDASAQGPLPSALSNVGVAAQPSSWLDAVLPLIPAGRTALAALRIPGAVVEQALAGGQGFSEWGPTKAISGALARVLNSGQAMTPQEAQEAVRIGQLAPEHVPIVTEPDAAKRQAMLEASYRGAVVGAERMLFDPVMWTAPLLKGVGVLRAGRALGEAKVAAISEDAGQTAKLIEQMRLNAVGEKLPIISGGEEAAAKGTVTYYSGRGGTGGAGEGLNYWSTNPQRARSFGPEVYKVEVPSDVAQAAQAAARAEGSGTAGDAILPQEWINKAVRAGEVKPTTYNLSVTEPLTGSPEIDAKIASAGARVARPPEKLELTGETRPGLLRRIGQAMQNLTERTTAVLGPERGEQMERVMLQEGRLYNAIAHQAEEAGFGKLTDAEQFQLYQVLENRIPLEAASARVQEVAKVARPISDAHAQYWISTGRTMLAQDGDTIIHVPFEQVEGHYPNMPDWRVIRQMTDEQALRLLAADNPGVNEEALAMAWNKLQHTARGESPLNVSSPLQANVPGFLRQRSDVHLPYEMLLPPDQALPLYWRAASKDIAIGSEIGPEQVFLNDIKNSDSPDKRALLDFYRRWRGWSSPNPDAKVLADLSRTGTSLATFLFTGPMTALKHTTQMALSWSKLPTQDFAVGFARLFSADARLRAQLSGSLVDDVLRELSGAVTEGAGSLIQRAAQAGAKYSGIRFAFRMGRALAYLGEESYLNRMAAQLGSEVPAEVSAAREALTSAGVKLDAPALSDEITLASARFSAKIQPRADVGWAPAYTSVPELQMVRGLNMYRVGYTKILMKEFLRPTFKPADFDEWISALGSDFKLVAGMTGAGAAITETRRFLTGSERPQSLAGHLAEYWGAASLLGAFHGFLNNMYDKSGNFIGLENVPAQAAKNVGSDLMQLATGSGLPALAGIGYQALKRPATLIPQGVGTLVNQWLKNR